MRNTAVLFLHFLLLSLHMGKDAKASNRVRRSSIRASVPRSAPKLNNVLQPATNLRAPQYYPSYVPPVSYYYPPHLHNRYPQAPIAHYPQVQVPSYNRLHPTPTYVAPQISNNNYMTQQNQMNVENTNFYFRHQEQQQAKVKEAIMTVRPAAPLKVKTKKVRIAPLRIKLPKYTFELKDPVIAYEGGSGEVVQQSNHHHERIEHASNINLDEHHSPQRGSVVISGQVYELNTPVVDPNPPVSFHNSKHIHLQPTKEYSQLDESIYEDSSCRKIHEIRHEQRTGSRASVHINQDPKEAVNGEYDVIFPEIEIRSKKIVVGGPNIKLVRPVRGRCEHCMCKKDRKTEQHAHNHVEYDSRTNVDEKRIVRPNSRLYATGHHQESSVLRVRKEAMNKEHPECAHNPSESEPVEVPYTHNYCNEDLRAQQTIVVPQNELAPHAHEEVEEKNSTSGEQHSNCQQCANGDTLIVDEKEATSTIE